MGVPLPQSDCVCVCVCMLGLCWKGVGGNDRVTTSVFANALQEVEGDESHRDIGLVYFGGLTRYF